MAYNKKLAEQIKQQAAEKRAKCLIPFNEDEWHVWDEIGDEEYTVPLIKKYLRTPEQKEAMNKLDISIEDMLNGRVEGQAGQDFTALTFVDWNAKLGYTHFGY